MPPNPRGVYNSINKDNKFYFSESLFTGDWLLNNWTIELAY